LVKPIFFEFLRSNLKPKIFGHIQVVAIRESGALHIHRHWHSTVGSQPMPLWITGAVPFYFSSSGMPK